MSERLLLVLRRIFFVLAMVYLLACALLYVRQGHFIFFPEAKIKSTPADFGCTFEDVTIPEKNHKLQGWWLPGANGKAVLYLHGNGGNIGANAEHACRFQKMGFSTLLFDYRGYGRSDGGFPSEKSVYEDADRAWSYLIEKHVAPADIVIYGHSLGGAVAIELARRHPDARGLIVESAFTSLADMSARDRLNRVFPLRLLLTEQMDSISKVASLKMPILFIHGTADQLVPSFMTEQLFDQARGRKSLFLVSGAGHENCAATAGKRYGEVVLKFVGSSEVTQTSGAATAANHQ
jgi:pimeloyl-ACP methyl ester carboxylesterase